MPQLRPRTPPLLLVQVGRLLQHRLLLLLLLLLPLPWTVAPAAVAAAEAPA